MTIKRFEGVNNRDVMRQVRAELGPDALILSSRTTASGVEITARADTVAPATEPVPTSSTPSPAPAATVSTTPQQTDGTADFAGLAQQLLAEVQEMRAQLNQQEVTPATPVVEPRTTQLTQQLVATGLSPELAAELVEQLEVNGEIIGDDAAAVATLLNDYLLQATAPLELLESGGVVALVGPTGVGKTTTTAKLAAHYLQHHKPADLALITTDSYRIGAREQLQIYADLLGVDLYGLDAAADWEALREQLATRKLVLVDTVGMSQRDQRVVSQLHNLAPAGRRTRLVLLLNAASRRETLSEVVQAHRQAAQQAELHLDDCIITKQDEALHLGAALDTVINAGLRLHFVSHGQRVPEDISPWQPELLTAEPLPPAVSGPAGLQTAHWQPDLVLQQGRRLTRIVAQLRQQVPEFAALLSSWSGLSGAWEPPAVAAAHWYVVPEQEGDWIPALNAAGVPLPLPRPRPLAEAPEARLILPREPAAEPSVDTVWIAPMHRNRRVWQDEQRQSVQQCYAQAAHLGSIDVHYQGARQELQVRRAPVSRATDEQPLALLMASVRKPGQRHSSQYYWLTPAGVSDQTQLALVQAELYGRQQRQASKQAWDLLLKAELDELPATRQYWLAQALAGVVTHLQTRGDELAPLRDQLLRLTGRRGQADSRKLLRSCWQLLTAYHAMHYVQQQTEGVSW